MAIGTTAALLIGGGLLGSAALSSSASRSAGSAVQGATDRAADLQNQQFQQLLALQMPGYNRAEDAGTLYSQALGIPSRRPSMTQGYQTGQPGATVSYGGFQPSMTGGYQPGYSGDYSGGNPTYHQTDYDSGYGPVDYGQPQVNGGPGDGYTAPAQTGQTGTTAGGGMMTGGGQQGIYDMVRNTPGYQNQLDQGLKAIDRAAPLVGGMYSGRRMKALNDYGQQTFGSYYDSWLNRVGGVAGQSQQISSNIGTQGAASAANQGNLMVQGANARAQGQVSSANAWSGAIGTGVGLYGGSQGWFGR